VETPSERVISMEIIPFPYKNNPNPLGISFENWELEVKISKRPMRSIYDPKEKVRVEDVEDTLCNYGSVPIHR
jgi:hypothetical protein